MRTRAWRYVLGRSATRVFVPPLNGAVTVESIGPGGSVRSARAALRAAAKQVRATLEARTVARLFEPP